jgi:hypothetical protein
MVLTVMENGRYPREINVRLSPFGGGPHPLDGTVSSSSSSPPEIVDAEIVEKDNGRSKPFPNDYWAATV